MRFPSLFACCLGDTGHPARPSTRGPRGAERAPLAESAAQFEFIGELCRDYRAEKSRVFLSLCTGDSQCSQLSQAEVADPLHQLQFTRERNRPIGCYLVYLSIHPTGIAGHPTGKPTDLPLPPAFSMPYPTPIAKPISRPNRQANDCVRLSRLHSPIPAQGALDASLPETLPHCPETHLRHLRQDL